MSALERVNELNVMKSSSEGSQVMGEGSAGVLWKEVGEDENETLQGRLPPFRWTFQEEETCERVQMVSFGQRKPRERHEFARVHENNEESSKETGKQPNRADGQWGRECKFPPGLKLEEKEPRKRKHTATGMKVNMADHRAQGVERETPNETFGLQVNAKSLAK
ncbi:hypothetical protein RUM44_002441 [Polyplax serrata]|uniref:Uncharacterized protein n=1 Tax=Polyplax serrata TaxID=468196 RepID=A0ABR1AET0_POLSC